MTNMQTEKQNTKNPKIEFSKLVLALAIVMWVVGAVYGAIIVYEEHTQLGELFAYIGAPATTAYGFYYWKSKAENVIKMTKSQVDKLKEAENTNECT